MSCRERAEGRADAAAIVLDLSIGSVLLARVGIDHEVIGTHPVHDTHALEHHRDGGERLVRDVVVLAAVIVGTAQDVLANQARDRRAGARDVVPGIAMALARLRLPRLRHELQVAEREQIVIPHNLVPGDFVVVADPQEVVELGLEAGVDGVPGVDDRRGDDLVASIVGEARVHWSVRFVTETPPTSALIVLDHRTIDEAREQLLLVVVLERLHQRIERAAHVVTTELGLGFADLDHR